MKFANISSKVTGYYANKALLFTLSRQTEFSRIQYSYLGCSFRYFLYPVFLVQFAKTIFQDIVYLEIFGRSLVAKISNPILSVKVLVSIFFNH